MTTTNRQSGFTVLELLIAVVFLLAAGTVFFIQKRDLEATSRDTQRKTAINAMYYNLEDVYYPAHHAYPEHLTTDQLKGLDPAQLKDPFSVQLGDYGGNYSYTPKDCKDGQCASYTLTADLEYEANFTKTSRTH